VKTIFYLVLLPIAFAILLFITLLTFWSCAQVIVDGFFWNKQLAIGQVKVVFDMKK